MRVTVIGGGSWGTAFSVVLRDRGHEVTLACRDPSRPRRSRPTGETRATSRTSTCTGIAATTIDEAPVAEANLVVVAVPSAAFGDDRRRASRAPARSSASRRGSTRRPGDRLSTLVANRPVAVLSGPNIAEEISRGLPAAAVIAGEDRGARGPAPARDHLADVPRLRERRRRRRRALRGREERDRARRRRCRRARARRQRQGRARRARSRRDGPVRRGGRCAARDVRRPRRDGRPDRHVLVEVGAQPPLPAS